MRKNLSLILVGAALLGAAPAFAVSLEPPEHFHDQSDSHFDAPGEAPRRDDEVSALRHVIDAQSEKIELLQAKIDSLEAELAALKKLNP